MRNDLENHIINLKDINEDNCLEDNLFDENENFYDNNYDDKFKQKSKLKYTELIDKIKNGYKKEFAYKNEYLCNILLMPPQIVLSNKISTLSLISYCYQESHNFHLIYNIARKFENCSNQLKALDPIFFINVFYRAAIFYQENNNFIYALKYIDKTISIIKDYSNIQENKIVKCRNMFRDIKDIVNAYLIQTSIKFNDGSFFSVNQCNDIKDKIKLILEGKNIFDNNDKNNNYLYVINKYWLIKLKNFIEDYLTCIEMMNVEDFFPKIFELKFFFNSYFKNIDLKKEINTKNDKNTEQQKEKKKTKDKKNNKKKDKNKENNVNKNYSPFPGPINNYNITDFKDIWYDNINFDENDFLKNDLKLNEDYCLIDKNDWDLLNSYFNSTNALLRKANNLDLTKIKFILFDKRINNKNKNINLLKLKYIQINKNSTLKQLKEKIINIANFNLEKKEKQNNKDNLVENKNTNDREIVFYTLDKDKRELLIEMCYSFTIPIQKYTSLYINKLEVSDGMLLEDFFSEYNKEKTILIIEIIQKDDDAFFEDLKIKMKNEYKCAFCNKKINHINDKYNCSFCNFSLFCSKKCIDKSDEHMLLHKELEEIMESSFNLSDLFSLKLDSLLSVNIAKGRVGLHNLGNTCYLNSSLQCLSNTEDLTKYFLNGDFSKEINNANSSGSKGLISKAYFNLINLMWRGKYAVISPNDFRLTFARKEDYFYNNEQHDSQEFLLSLLNNLNDELNRVTNKQYMELKEKQENETDEEASQRYWDYQKSRENSIIVDLFQGQYKSSITCFACQYQSVTFDTYMNLQLPIPSKKMQSQIKFLLSNGDCIKLSIKLDDNTEIKDVIKRALIYLDNKKYLEYFLNEKIKNNIFNFNNSKVPEYLLYNNIIVAEFSSDLKLTNIYNTCYTNIINNINDYVICDYEEVNKKGKEKNNNNKNIEFIPRDREKISNIYEKNKNREIVLFEKNMNFKDEDTINIFIYPIADIETKGFLGAKIETNSLSYPILLTLNKNDTFKKLNIFIEQKLSKIIKKTEKNKQILMCYPHFSDNWLNFKKMNSICPICGDIYSKNIKYCLLSKKFNFDNKIKELIDLVEVKNNLIIFAGSQSYNLESQLYKGIKLLKSKKEGEIKKDLTIYDSLELFKKEEILDGDEKWYCSKCGKHQKAIKKMEIYRTPYYLIVQLKRFKQRGALMRSFLGNKNETYIDYKEILNLSDFVSGPDKKESIYLLYGVVIHKKLLNGGHYISICKNDGEWVLYNDNKFGFYDNPINKDAYLLFYKRKTDN